MDKTNVEKLSLSFLSNLPSYRLRSILIRISLVSCVGMLFIIFARNITINDMPYVQWLDYLKIVIVFNLLSEVNVMLDNIWERFFPIPKYLTTRIILHLGISLLLGAPIILYFESYIEDLDIFEDSMAKLMIVFGFIFVTFLILLSITIRIMGNWMNSQSEIEDLKQSKLRSDYNALQDQLNPHFLFNNLSVLKSMIIYDTSAAVDFTQDFTDVYRYVLQSRDKTTIKLSEELNFIHAYLGLHKKRLEDGLKIELSVDKSLLNSTLPPLSLQLLVENAIKHNVASSEKPLTITVTAQNNRIIVSNNLQIKEASYSTYTGLSNLKKRYELLTNKQIEIESDELCFNVSLPLL